MRAHRAEEVCQVFVAIRHLLREIIATSGSYYGVLTGPIRAVSVPFGDTFTRSDGTETPYWTFGMRGHRAEKSAKYSSLSETLLREIIATSGSYYG
ncbi:hypothetical protein DPMN_177468 [Dreissena polymorpha]|uniref:Uncharacterized protein n=1 Tax=Dreissena polymorpha TaxID=45954 RepID=A0A9D4ED37_DREPO|nr:hypothetical protein DPMN_177468 [Dreissena polymorpha]